MCQESTTQFCTFRLGGFRMAFEVSAVQEVLQQSSITAVPLAAPAVRGLMNLRGQIITVMDLRRVFEFDDRELDQPETHVIVHTNDGVVSFLVDEVEDVVTLNRATVELPPSILEDLTRDFVSGIVQMPGYLLIILDRLQCASVASRRNDLPVS